MSDTKQSSYHGIAARLDRMPISGFHKKILWLLAGITFCDSVDMAVGGPIGNILQNTYDAAGNQWMTLEQFALFNSITMIGYLIGGLMAGALSDGIGRKKAVLICGSIFTAFCFVAAGSPDATFLTACRFFMGLGLGAAFPAGYSALTEFTPPTKRGKYQSYVGLIANCGTLVASAMNMVVLPMLGWRPVFIICGCIGLLVVVLCFVFLEESPRWLAMKGKCEEADAIVSRLEQKSAEKGNELTMVPESEIDARAAEEKVDELPWSFLFKKKVVLRTLTAMFLCFTMNVLVYTVITWTPTILTKNGFDPHMSTTLTVVMQLGIPVGVGLLTFYVEKVNRKVILCTTYVLIAIIGPVWASLPTDNTALIMFVGFLLCVCTFTNSVTTAAIYLSEPFPTACRIRGAGVANAFGRLGSIFSPMWISFLITTSLGTMGVFLINGGIAIFMAIWLAIFGVETRGRTLEDITKGLLDD
jgi:MFS transporter, putative metabolite:H+ symporter